MVLYGVLSFANRTSRWGRNTFAAPNSGSRAAQSATIGPRTASAYTPLCFSQNARVFSCSRSS